MPRLRAITPVRIELGVHLAGTTSPDPADSAAKLTKEVWSNRDCCIDIRCGKSLSIT